MPARDSGELRAALAGSGQQPTPEDAAKIQAAASDLDNPTFKEASARVTAWFAEVCAA